MGCEFYQARYYLETDILEHPFQCEGGHVTLPDGPGLGIEIDRAALRRFAPG
ncbi:MAG: enolase C-terminal domain-like protein [Pseudomonadota bacterium]